MEKNVISIVIFPFDLVQSPTGYEHVTEYIIFQKEVQI